MCCSCVVVVAVGVVAVALVFHMLAAFAVIVVYPDVILFVVFCTIGVIGFVRLFLYLL